MMPSMLGAELEGVERLLVGRRHVGDAAGVAQPGMLRPDAGIVEAGGDRVAFEDLAVVVLEEIGAVAVEHARPAAVHRGGVAVLDVEPVAAGLDAVDGRPRDRRGRDGRGRWRSSRRRCRRRARRAGGLRPAMICSRVSRPITDWKSRTMLRIGMRAGGGADQVVGVLDIGHPVAQRLVHGVLERAVAGGDRHAPRRRAASCGRRWASAARRRSRPCRRRRAGRSAPRRWRRRRRAGRRRSRR